MAAWGTWLWMMTMAAVVVDGRGLIAVVETGLERSIEWTTRALATEKNQAETTVFVESAEAAVRNYENRVV